MPIKIDFLSNTRDAVRGVEDYGDALDKVSSSLDDVTRDADRAADKIADSHKDSAREADRAGEKIGDAYKDGAREAESAAERLERSFKEASDATARSSKQGADDLGKNVKRGTDDAKEGLNEFKDEANSTAKESAASFDGSFESIGDVIQEISANAFAGFGPAGAIAGIAAAAGIGIAIAKMQEGAESTERFKERVGELTGELIEVGTGTVGVDYIIDKLKEMATATDDAEVSLADLKDVADDSGSSYKDLAQAYAGSADGLDKLIKKTEEQKAALEGKNAAEQEGLSYLDKVGGDDPRIAATEKYISYLKDAKKAQQEAAEEDENYAAAGGRQAEARVAATEALKKANDDLRENQRSATEEYVSSIQSASDAAGSAIEEFVTDAGFNLDGYNEQMEKSAQAIQNYQANVVAASENLSAEALEYIRSLGPAAAPALQAFIDAPNEQKARTAANWDAQGKIASDAFSSKLQSQINGANFNTRVIVTPDMQRVYDELNKTRVINIEARVRNNISSQLPANQGMGVP